MERDMKYEKYRVEKDAKETQESFDMIKSELHKTVDDLSLKVQDLTLNVEDLTFDVEEKSLLLEEKEATLRESHQTIEKLKNELKSVKSQAIASTFGSSEASTCERRPSQMATIPEVPSPVGPNRPLLKRTSLPNSRFGAIPPGLSLIWSGSLYIPDPETDEPSSITPLYLQMFIENDTFSPQNLILNLLNENLSKAKGFYKKGSFNIASSKFKYRYQILCTINPSIIDYPSEGYFECQFKDSVSKISVTRLPFYLSKTRKYIEGFTLLMGSLNHN
jgi:hypothetical protein